MLYCLHKNLDYPKTRSHKKKLDGFGQLIYKSNYKYYSKQITILKNKPCTHLLFEGFSQIECEETI